MYRPEEAARAFARDNSCCSKSETYRNWVSVTAHYCIISIIEEGTSVYRSSRIFKVVSRLLQTTLFLPALTIYFLVKRVYLLGSYWSRRYGYVQDSCC